MKYFIFLSFFCISVVGHFPVWAQGFQLPEVPAGLTAPADRADYLAVHYWDYFDFSDTALIHRPEITEQAFVDFLSVLHYSDRSRAAVDTLLSRAEVNEAMLTHFMELSEKYLYEPDSPLCNEELYIDVLRSLSGRLVLPEAERIRLGNQLELVSKNRPGKVAANFDFLRRDGRCGRLSEVKAGFVLLYFNDPGCEDCRRTAARIAASPVFSFLQKRDSAESNRLTVLSVCIGNDREAWQSTVSPPGWIDGFDEKQQIINGGAYHLKMVPTLYLLDKDKRVILKDTTVEQVEGWLKHLM